MKLLVSLEITALVVAVTSGASAKEASRFVTAEMRANARENVKKHSWAEAEQMKAIAAAERWLKMSDDELWDLIPSGELPRSSASTYWVSSALGVGCPNCGKAE